MARFLASAALLLSMSACTTVDTRPLASGSQGIAYQLPLGKMRLRVTEASGVVSVLLDGPFVVGDPDHALVARLPQSGAADNNVTVTVDAKTNLLNKVEVVSTGKLTEILTNATKSVVFLQSSNVADGTTLFGGLYAVDELPSAASAANAKLAEYFTSVCGDVIAGGSPRYAAQLKAVEPEMKDEAAAVKERLLRCRKMADAGADAAERGSGLIKIDVQPVAARPAVSRLGDRPSGSAPDTKACMRGICYRPYRPREVTLGVRGAFQLSDVFLLPDPDSLIHVDLPSGLMAEQKYTLDFTDGVLTKYQRDGKSELVGLASLPFTIVEAALSAPASALGLKQKNIEAQANYLDAVGKLVDKQKAVREACDGAAKAATCPDTAYKLIGGPVSNEKDKPVSQPVGDSDAPSDEG